MCRSDVAPQARKAMERLLLDMRQALADLERVDPSSIVVGPVDFGSPQEPEATA